MELVECEEICSQWEMSLETRRAFLNVHTLLQWTHIITLISLLSLIAEPNKTIHTHKGRSHDVVVVRRCGHIYERVPNPGVTVSHVEG